MEIPTSTPPLEGTVPPVSVERSLSQTNIPEKSVTAFNKILAAGQDIGYWSKFELKLASGNIRQSKEDRQVFLDQMDRVDWESFSKLPVKTDDALRTQMYDAFHVCRRVHDLGAENKWDMESYSERTDNPFDTYPGLKPPADEDIQRFVVGFFKQYYKPEFKK